MPSTSHQRAFLRAVLALLTLAAILAGGRPVSATATAIYVVQGGTGDGSSWTNGKDLAAALADAVAPAELWVKAGAYKPTTLANPSDPRSATYRLTSGVAVYGGFAGGESSRDQRNPTANVTILSGDLLGNDQAPYQNMDENVYHVVTVPAGVDASAVLDGFTIQGGNADGVPPAPPVPYGTLPPNEGGGMFIDSVSSPTVANVVLKRNMAAWDGGGIHIGFNSSPTLTNVTFILNVAGRGGGLYNSGNGNTTLTNGAFIANTGTYNGGGVYNDQIAGLTLTNVVFRGNLAYTSGGGLYNDTARAVLTNVSVNGNYADTSGGGLYSTNSSNSPSYSPVVRNSIVWGNSKGEITIFGTGSPTVTYSIVKGGYTGVGNFDADPQFVSPVTPDPNNTPTTAGDLHLRAGSRAAGAGSNNVADPSLPATDLDGKPRIMGGVVDMGAYEFVCPLDTPARLYVNAAVSGGTGNGQAWANAFPSLATALSIAARCANVTEVWVAKGTYKPTSGSDRNATFVLRNDLAVYGGFTSGQSSLSQRDPNPATNNTVLSGDLLGNDGADFANNGDNSYHVVTANWVDNTAILDGFTISGGNATDFGGGLTSMSATPSLTNLAFRSNFAGGQGGALYTLSNLTLTNVSFSGNSSGNGGGAMLNAADLILTNVTFSGNKSSGSGGAILSNGGSATLTNVTFSDNASVSDGGAMFNNGSSPTLTNVTFIGNSALDGGGIANNGDSPTLTNVVFKGNSANGVNANTGFGGGMYSNGGNATLTNVVFSGNFASNGGGGLANNGSSPTLTNVTLSGNKASGTGGGMYNNTPGPYAGASSPVVRNSIFWGNTGGEIAGPGATVTYSLVQGGFAGTGNLSTDPKFVAPITAAAPTTTGDLHLQYSSGAVNAGSNAFVTGISTDADGAPRVVDGTVDMGAYETHDATPPTVTRNATADSCSLPGTSGWCRGIQRAGFTASDTESGVATPCVGALCSFTQSSAENGSAVTIASGQVCDAASNCAPGISAGPFKIDSTPPTLNPTISPNPPLLGGAAAAAPNAADTTSGVASQSCDPVDTSSAGPKTLTCRATDNAGNTGSVVVNYTVGYKVSYVSPMVGPPSVNNLYAPSFGTGYTPIRWRVTNAGGTAITAPGTVTTVRFAPMMCGGTLPTYSDSLAVAGGYSSANPKYDTSQKAWVFNWQLPATKGCYAVYIKLNSGDILAALYRLN